MSKAQLVITAVVLEGRSKSEVARDYDISRQWVQQLVKRYEAEGEAAYLPRSRRPHRSPQAITIEVEERIVRLRKTLTKRGLDAGADTIAAHLATDPNLPNVPATSTIWRTLKRRGFVTPQPHKRPRSSWKRFEAELPNQRWQADVTHWHLSHGGGVEILNILDDHCRLAIASLARHTRAVLVAPRTMGFTSVPIPTVADAVQMIHSAGLPRQILKPVVVRNIVPMSRLMAGRARADKRLQNKRVHLAFRAHVVDA